MSKTHSSWTAIWRAVTAGAAAAALAVPVLAAYPPPANDTPATAETITSLPAIRIGSNVGGTDDINVTTLGNLPSVPGADVFYSFTPEATGTYWITMIPWVQVPVYSSSGANVPVPNLCVYIREAATGVFVAGSDANPRGIPDVASAALTAGTAYEIVVDSAETVLRAQEYEFTLVVAQPATGPDNCAAAEAISNDLPTAVVGNLTGAVDDFTFQEGTGRCDVVDTSGLFLPGPDHVYSFTTGPTPDAEGDYVFTLVPGGTAWNGHVYIADSCPPFFPLGCLGAASHTANTVRQAESIVVSLTYDTTYYVYVDAGTLFLPDGKYTLLVDRAENWAITEVEDNDSPATASDPVPGLADGGQIAGAADVDFWAFDALGGEKLYAFVDNGNVLLSGIDSELRLLAPDGTSLIEFDDDDGEGSLSPIPTLYQRSASFSAAIAGAPLSSAGTYYLQVDSAGLSTLARYVLHHGIQPAGRAPAIECEGNDSPGVADQSAKNYYTGAIETEGDVDWYVFDAVAGDRVFIALDGDPERNSGGSAADHPLALDGALEVVDPDGDVLIASHNDASGVVAGQEPDFPAEALAFVAPVTGRYTVGVRGGFAGDFGLGKTYELAIFKNDAAPALTEDTDPVIDGVTPDFVNDIVTIEASDDAAGDSGICAVELAPGSVNLVLQNVTFSPGDPTVTFDVGVVDAEENGIGKVFVIDCAGNTACVPIEIDTGSPSCAGSVVVPGSRTIHSTHGVLWAPDNQPSGPGVNGEIVVDATGTVADVNVTMTVETSRAYDIDAFLESPAGTRVELVTDRGGFGFTILDATFDDSAEEVFPLLSSAEPYTGRWLPEDPEGLAKLNGQSPTGTWKLNIIDDDSASTGGSNLVRWSLEIDAGFTNPEIFEGLATDNTGIQSIELVDPGNVQLNLPPDFTPGDLEVAYTVTLVNPSQGGSCTVRITDISNNTCTTPVTLVGLPDASGPKVDGAATRDLTFGAEVQGEVPGATPSGVVSAVALPDSLPVGEVEVGITVNCTDIGRIASTLTHQGEFAVLLNRVGMDERGSVGRTKDNIEVYLDDDAPVADDAHLEPALGTMPFRGLHQPDGRGEYIGDAINSDYRDNMLFALEGLDAVGDWELWVADYRLQGASGSRAIFRRWEAVVRSPGAAERFVATATDRFPEAGICTIAPAAGATNLAVQADFTPGADEVEFTVVLVDPALGGGGDIEITDCAGNVTSIAVTLAPAAADQALPEVSGAINPETRQFEGTATDNQAGDSGIATVELAPYADNLQIVSVTPDPPGGAAAVSFVVDRIDPNANGRGYVRVTDVTGYRRHVLVHIDAQGPECTGFVGRTKRYFSADLPQDIPDNSGGGASSTIVVPDANIITDLDITFNITHPFDDDIELALTSPVFLELFKDIGSTGNDFIDTTLDSDADFVIPDSSSEAPFTGFYQPQPPASLSIFDGQPAAGSYTLRAVDDAVYNVGTFESWSLTITAATYPNRYDGRAEDSGVFDFGICSIELLPDSANLALTVDPAFATGEVIVRYSVALANPRIPGSGTVRVTDCAGNYQDVPVCLAATSPPAQKGDLDGNNVINGDDWLLLEPCFEGPDSGGIPECDPCRLGDYDEDGDVDLLDLAEFQTSLSPT